MQKANNYLNDTKRRRLKAKEDWNYFAVKKLSALLCEIILKYDGDIYCLSFLHSFKTKNKLKSHEKLGKNKDFCGTIMPSGKENVLELNQYMKSDKIPYKNILLLTKERLKLHQDTRNYYICVKRIFKKLAKVKIA